MMSALSLIGRIGGAAQGIQSVSNLLGGSSTWGRKPRRRRRARLTQGDMMELANIKNILGKTAAANALPFYLGRGRG